MKLFGWLDDFAEFALRGNVVDMAVGFTVGAAFTTLVKSLVDNVIMPPIGYITSGIDFSDKKIILREAQPATDGQPAVDAVTLTYGQFINSCLTFVIVALAVFFIVRIANRAQKAFMEEDKPKTDEAAKVPEDIQLLREIRDELRGASQTT